MTTALVIKTQKQALEGLSKPLRAVFDKIVVETKNLQDANVWSRYKIGVYLVEVTGNERKYGDSAIERLAAALGGALKASNFWECRALTNSFTEDQIRNILSKKMASGASITFTHLKFLCSLTPKMKKDLIVATLKESLSSDELNERIQAKVGGKRGKGGRTVQAPKTINGGLNQIAKFSGDIHKRIGVWSLGVFDKIRKGPPDDITGDTSKLIDATAKEVTQMIADGQKLLGSLEQADARCKTVLAKRKVAKKADKVDKKKSAKASSNRSASKKAKKKKASSSASSKVKAAKKKRAVKEKAARPQPT